MSPKERIYDLLHGIVEPTDLDACALVALAYQVAHFRPMFPDDPELDMADCCATWFEAVRDDPHAVQAALKRALLVMEAEMGLDQNRS